MNAWVVKTPGPGAGFELVDVPRPTPGPGEVLVRIQAAGVNPIDAKTKEGHGFSDRLPEPPWILGWDLAGEVVALGPGASLFRQGDAVLGLVRFPQLGACYAEYAAVPEADLARRPPALGIYEAAGLPLAGLTAWQCFEDPALSLLAANHKRILVVGASGGVGHLLVGLGVLFGAEIWGLGSESNRAKALKLGAAGYLAYDNWPDGEVPRFDGLVDSVGDPAMERLWDLLNPRGLVIRLVGGENHAQADGRDLAVQGLLVRPDGVALGALAEAVASRSVTLRLEKVFPIDQVNEAHATLAQGRSVGKIVLAVAT